MPFGRYGEIKILSRIKDYQHLYYPQYFTSLQRILSSNASASDLKKIINFNLKKIFLHPFFWKLSFKKYYKYK